MSTNHDAKQDAKGDTALDECFWFVFTTMHGIGFGEYSARGVAGRMIAMFCCTVGYWFTIFMMGIIMMSQLPGEKTPTLCSVISRMFSALWPSYSVFLSIVLAVGSVVGPYVSKDHAGNNLYSTGFYWAWTTVHRTPYGDVFPDTVFGRTVTVPIAMMGVLYMPYALACIAVRCPSAAQHREMVGRLRSHPEDAMGCGYVEPPEAAGSASGLADLVSQDSYAKETEEEESSHRCRSGVAVCLLLTFVLFTISPTACRQILSSITPTQVQVVIEHTLELDLPPGIRAAADPVPPVVWTFWLHDYPLEGAALQNYNSLPVTLDNDVQLVTTKSLALYNVTEWPFHPALAYLAPNHKLDYIHAYWMHHYGGGVLPIKERMKNSTWTAKFDYIGDNETFWFLGEPSAEAVTCDESNVGDVWCKELQWKTKGASSYKAMHQGMSSWEPSKGPCCSKVLQYFQNNTGRWPNHEGYIVRKQTGFTKDLLTMVDQHLTAKLAQLKAHAPPSEPCCMTKNENYPLRWEELRGEILSVLLQRYSEHIKYDSALL